MATTTTGSCLCGTVRYTITGDPVMRVLCHCFNCRKASGSHFAANGFFNDSQFAITHGEDALTVYHDGNTAGGNTTQRSFCSKCGSPVSTRSPGNEQLKGKVAVMSGLLDKDDEGAVLKWQPQAEFFCRSRGVWLPTELATAKFQAAN